MESNIGGNYFDKHNSNNPLVKALMRNFYRTFLDILDEHAFRSLVDVGCGEGHLTNIIREHLKQQKRRVRITALEYEPATVKIANHLYPHLKVRRGDILKLRGNYDVLVSSEVLEHVPDYDAALRRCAKTAKLCIFSVPHEPFFRMANLCRLRYVRRLGNTPGHVNNWTRPGLRRLLKRHFRNVEVRSTGIWNVAVCS